ncbi:predicted protein [Plenodomus lingam JN3]|uniref:Predicted protein n=1 Tax=Leptosphaeria maculans (strain JN3 / isolate v23.1.3 / race Av1-4-5-6-7-8) TaxID=985895 RepID=E5A1G3_LEPMJ|nr:predicted protein [Plenodomus lingam JN3]CBX97427.1 predicted protein [Plenodomus lingam JN3]
MGQSPASSTRWDNPKYRSQGGGGVGVQSSLLVWYVLLLSGASYLVPSSLRPDYCDTRLRVQALEMRHLVPVFAFGVVLII